MYSAFDPLSASLLFRLVISLGGQDFTQSDESYIHVRSLDGSLITYWRNQSIIRGVWGTGTVVVDTMWMREGTEKWVAEFKVDTCFHIFLPVLSSSSRLDRIRSPLKRDPNASLVAFAVFEVVARDYTYFDYFIRVRLLRDSYPCPY